MGPLVPFGIIGQEFNYIIALFLGFAFGYVLEQAGFSTSRKLVGVFYGYDYVVLRVFFTAAVTAAIGMILLDAVGALDLSYMYVNPMYMGPAIVGGVIMGLGFILGGFCPGTSVVAAAVGKVDAWIFVFGSFLGIFLFGEMYPLLKDFYVSGYQGSPYVYESLGISRAVFVAALTIIALGAFVFTSFLEKRVSYGWKPQHPKYNMAIPAIAVGVVFAVVILILPSEHDNIAEMKPDEYKFSEQDFIAVDAAAYDFYYNVDKFTFIDVRDTTAYKQYCLPGAVHMRLDKITDVRNEPYFKNPLKIPVFYSENDTDAEKALMLAHGAGYTNAVMMRGGMTKFREVYDSPSVTKAGFIGDNTSEFRLKVRQYLLDNPLETKPQVKKKVEKKIIEVQGGC